MKILVFTSYLTIPKLKGFNKNHSGFGYMVAAITLGIASLSNLKVDVLTQSNFTDQTTFKKAHFIKRNLMKLLSFFKLSTLIHAFNERNKYHNSDFKRQFIYGLTSNYFKSIVKHYSAVHIHGISSYTYQAIDYCLKNNIKGIVTIHGINYLNTSIGISQIQIEKEKEFIQRITNSKNLKLTVISKGIQLRITNSLDIKVDDIYIVPNFHDYNDDYKYETLDIKKKYNLPQSSEIILSVGNYSENKNQKQLIDIFELLDKENCFLLLVGSGLESLLPHIKNLKSKDRIVICGHVNRNLLPNYYINSSILAVTSVSEGFGLPMIEAEFYGLPVITFKDIDAVEDILENNNLALVSERNSELYKNHLEKGLAKDWDKEMLKKSVEKFEPSIILNKYKSLLKESIT